MAFLSQTAHGWPLEWYWHNQVRPAYSLITWIWGIYFAIKAATQYTLILADNLTVLTTVKIVMGWPASIGLLIISYWLGHTWLRRLQGPSVEEFEAKVEPPWSGQEHGF